jgi:ribonuclease Z
MHPRFHPRLVNGVFDDPALFIPFQFENRAILFDLGDLYALAPRDILKISHAFVTHTHMDHFIGFDRLLRLFLGREKDLYIYGPESFLKNAEGKLSGYAWNLVENFRYRFRLHLSEVRSSEVIRKEYRCRNKFLPSQKEIRYPFDGRLYAEPAFAVSAAVLDHRIPCLGLALKEQFHINIKKDRLDALGLEPGPWLNAFKQALYDSKESDAEFEVTFGKDKTPKRRFVLGELAADIALITPGQKIAYIADVAANESNAEKIIALAKDADHLFIEAAFLETDRRIAREKYHLTARQAGELAARAGVGQFTIFHFSPRYLGQESLLYREATEAFQSTRAILC